MALFTVLLGGVPLDSAAAQEPRPAAGEAVDLRGRVIDQAGVQAGAGAPVPGARVILEDLGRTARTDGQGTFRFSEVPEGSWTVRAEAAGFRTETMTVEVGAPGEGAVEVELSFSERFFEAAELVASVSPLENPVGYQPAQALDREQLARRMGPSLGTILDGEPGVAMRTMGSAPARPVIRGFDGDRVLVLENGERMGDLSETAADHAVSLDPLAMKRVEVVRGPASLLYGASALGGVVNLLTADIPDGWSRGWSGSVATQGASVNRGAAASGDVTYGTDHWAATSRLSLRETSDLRTPEARLPGTHLSSLDGQVGLAREQGGLRVGGSFSFTDRTYGIPEAIEDEDEEVFVEMERQAAQGFLNWRPQSPGAVKGLELRVSGTRFFQREIEQEFELSEEGRSGQIRRLIDEDIELEFLQHSATSTATLRHGALGPVGEGAVGVHLWGRNLDVGGEEAFTPGARRGTAGVFTFQEVPLSESLRFQVGARGEGQWTRTLSNDDFPESDERRSSAAFSGSVGLHWTPRPGWEVGGQLARAHRTPMVEELYADGPHLGAGAFEVGDPALPDEVGHGMDLFVRGGNDRLGFELAGFLNRINDFVAFQPTGEVDPASELPIFHYEATDARMSGGEVTLYARLPMGLQVEGGFDYVRGDRVGGITDGVPLPSVPPFRTRLELRYEGDRFWVGTTVRGVAKQGRVAPQEDPTSGYLLWDGDAGVRLDPDRGRHTLIVQVENATNRLYRDHLSRVEERGFPMPGRNVAVSYRLRF